MKILTLLLATLLFTGCAYFRATEEPIPMRWHVADGAIDEDRDTLLVFLPGARDTHDDIFDFGAIDTLVESGLPWDVVAVDAHLGYYRQQTVLERIEGDVMPAARERGYERIWFTGPSLGGFGSLFYWCRTRDEDVEGIIAMAPFMGQNAIVDRVRQAGGIREWDPDTNVGQEHERQLWSCLQDLPDERPEIWLAYGTQDHLAPANEMLADILPAERVLTSDGEHLWVDWIPLWERVFARIAERHATGSTTTAAGEY